MHFGSRILATIAVCFVSGAFAAPMTVVVDAGHGGRDDGAVRAGVTEASITLAVSDRVAQLLKADRRFRVHLTRDQNHFLSLPERTNRARDVKADVFVSIHVNASPDPRAKGAEFYFQNQLPPDEESMFLAHRENEIQEGADVRRQYRFLEENSFSPDVTSIVGDLLDGDRVVRSSQLAKALKVSWRGPRKSATGSVRQAPFFVLSQMRVPSALVELGFLTHPEDLADLTNRQSQKRMAEDIYRGLVAYKESMDKSAPTP